MSMLVVSGVMIGYICSAITELVVTFAEDADIVNLHNWSRGSFSGMTWDNVKVMSVVVAAAFLLVILLAKPLEAYQLGETYALARKWMAPTELSISTVTAIFGAPVVLWIMISRNRQERG